MSNKANGKKKLKKAGFCALTRKPGIFVKSHIIPLALTRPAVRGEPLMQYGGGLPPQRRWSSWYDDELVTKDGEKFLEELDTWAIRELRSHRLVWSGWGEVEGPGENHENIFGTIGIREVAGIDTSKLRLFFLSLLWRSAATRLTEFAHIQLPSDEIETLRRAIVREEAPPDNFYPIQLSQLSTRGVIHNAAPEHCIKPLPNFEDPDGPMLELPSIRFYLDGLIAHMHPPSEHVGSPAEIGKLYVGVESTFILSTVTYSGSLQRLSLEDTMAPYGIES